MTSFVKLIASLCLLTSLAVQAADGDIIGAPQTIPHEIGNFLPITPERNACLMCHHLAASEKHQPGEIPLSHTSNGKIAGSRWNCTFCHASGVPMETAPQAK